MKSQETIKKNLAALREMIESTQDPIFRAFCYEIETAVRWATRNTRGWDDLETQALRATLNLKEELGLSKKVDYPDVDPAVMAKALVALGVKVPQPAPRPTRSGKRTKRTKR